MKMKFFFIGHPRSIRAKKNIITSFAIRGMDMLLGFMLVPLTLNYLGQTKYGIWLTVISVVSWFNFMDIGLGNGLRNKFAEAKATGQTKKARIYVSTTYAVLSLIVVAFLVVFLIINIFLPWDTILNVDHTFKESLSKLALIVFGFYSLQFVLKLITTIIVADQRPAMRDGIQIISKILIFFIVFMLTKITTGSILYVAFAYSFMPILVLIFASLYFYKNKYRAFRPSINYVDLKYSKDLATLGFKFFILQTGAIILYATDNIIISQLFGPAEVVTYQIANKYFSLVMSVYLIVASPLWSAVTDAYAKENITWIKNTIKKYLLLCLSLSFIVIIFIIISKYIYRIWVGDEINIPYSLSSLWGITIIIMMFGSLFTTVLNGVGKLKISLITAVFTIVFNIPLSIIFAKNFALGINGVLLATMISIIMATSLRSIQYFKIVNNKAVGIWNA
ncbi:MAG: oligosaccharide flippase family protein [Ignavibacteriae bacterium]|nr:oligosaccharide flippase family protein [Ignavibacteriota bacterium]